MDHLGRLDAVLIHAQCAVGTIDGGFCTIYGSSHHLVLVVTTHLHSGHRDEWIKTVTSKIGFEMCFPT